MTDEVKVTQAKKEEVKNKQYQYVHLLHGLVQKFNKDMGDFVSPAVIKARDVQLKKQHEAKRATYKGKVQQVYATLEKSKLFCNFYFPDNYVKKAKQGDPDPYERFGFFWPRENDLVEICMKYDIEPKDLVLERVAWKKDGCGFSLLQLIFKGGIASPFFKTKDCEAENFKTTMVDQSKPIKHVRLMTAENKYVEKLEFLAKKDDIQDSDILAKLKACGCGEPVIWDVPEGHRLVGLYGLVASNKYVAEGVEQYDFDTIRGLGFLSLKLE